MFRFSRKGKEGRESAAAAAAAQTGSVSGVGEKQSLAVAQAGEKAKDRNPSLRVSTNTTIPSGPVQVEHQGDLRQQDVCQGQLESSHLNNL